MITFDQSLDKIMDVVKNWGHVQLLKSVTIIRDVLGKIALVLDAERAITDDELDGLQTGASQELGGHWRGNIYCKQNKNNDLVKMMIEEVETLRWDYNEINGIHWYLLERAIAKKAWVECNYREKAIWPFEDAQNGGRPKVVAFYSFKGGMGRTTSLAATTIALAERGNNVLVIDADIEAPGLASLFLDENSIQRGTVDYLLEANLNSGDIDMSQMIHQLNDPVLMEGIKGKIFVIPAGTIDQNYLQKLARIDYQDAIPNNMKKQICRMIEDAVDEISVICHLDYILLDSRAGFHDMGGVTTAQIPHGVVCFGKDSRQSWQGMNLVLKAIGSSQEDTPFVAIVDSTCGQNGFVSIEDKRLFKEQAYTICCDSFYTEGEGQPGLDAQDEAHSAIFIPYFPLLTNDIQLYSDGSERKNEMVKQTKQLMLDDTYQEIRKRIEMWFGGEEGAESDGQAADS